MKEKYIQSLVFDVPHEDQVLKVYFELKYGANTAMIKPYFKSDPGHFPLSLAIGYESDDAPFDSEADLLEDITKEKIRRLCLKRLQAWNWPINPAFPPKVKAGKIGIPLFQGLLDFSPRNSVLLCRILWAAVKINRGTV